MVGTGRSVGTVALSGGTVALSGGSVALSGGTVALSGGSVALSVGSGSSGDYGSDGEFGKHILFKLI